MSKYEIKGKSVSDIANMSQKSFESLTRKQLATATSRLASAANKRLDRLTKAGYKSDAVQYVKKHGGRFSVKGKSEEQLRSEFMRAKHFLELKTSSVKEINKNLRDFAKLTGLPANKKTYDKFWKLMTKYREEHPAAANNAYRDRDFSIIKAALKSRSGESSYAKAASKLSQLMTEEYQRTQEARNDLDIQGFELSDLF